MPVPVCPRREQAERQRGRLREDERPVGALRARRRRRPGSAGRRRCVPALRRVRARLDERRLELVDRPRRVALREQRRRARDVRRTPCSSPRTRPSRLRRSTTARRRPGAATSGLRRSEIVVGPTDENSACVRVVGLPPIATAPTAIARVGVGRRRHGAGAEIVVVVSGGDDRHDAGGCGRVERERDDVAARLDLRLAAREVDHVHAVGDRRLDRGDDRGRVRVRAQPRARLDEDLVVAEVRTRRDARDTPAPSAFVSAFPAAMPATCVPWLESSSEYATRALAAVALFGAKTRATMTFARREALLPFGKPAGIDVAGRVEERVRRVDPGVDDPDLHALPGGVERLAPERRSADLLRRGRQLRRVAPRREDVANTRQRAQPLDARSSAARARSRSRRAGSASRSRRREPARRARSRNARCSPRDPRRPSRARRASGGESRRTTTSARSPLVDRHRRPARGDEHGDGENGE